MADITIPKELDEGLTRKLAGEEGRKACVYLDSLGFQTIAIGRLVDKRKPGAGLSLSEQDFLLANDKRRVYAQVVGRWPWVLQLSIARQGTLMELAFQLGIGGLAGFVNTLKLLQGSAFDAAADALLQSTLAKQTPERAKRMSDQLRVGGWIWKPGT